MVSDQPTDRELAEQIKAVIVIIGAPSPSRILLHPPQKEKEACEEVAERTNAAGQPARENQRAKEQEGGEKLFKSESKSGKEKNVK